MEPNICKTNYTLCGDNEIEGGENIHFTTENKQKVEDEVVVSQCTNGSRESYYNMNLKSDNV